MKVTTKSKKVNKAWLNDHVNDPYVKLAQREGYRARAAYKLKVFGNERVTAGGQIKRTRQRQISLKKKAAE